MQLQGINWDYHRPPDDSFVHVLGTRGEEAIRVLIRHLKETPRHRTPYFYRPILSDTKFASKFDICGTSYYELLEKVLVGNDGPPGLRRRGKRDLAKYCADPLGVPWDN